MFRLTECAYVLLKIHIRQLSYFPCFYFRECLSVLRFRSWFAYLYSVQCTLFLNQISYVLLVLGATQHAVMKRLEMGYSSVQPNSFSVTDNSEPAANISDELQIAFLRYGPLYGA